MRALTLVLSAFIAVLATTEVSALGPQNRMTEGGYTMALESHRSPASESASVDKTRYTCRIITGYGTAIGFGTSKLAAKENAREICGEKIIDGYIAQRGQIPEDVIGDLTTACINEECR